MKNRTTILVALASFTLAAAPVHAQTPTPTATPTPSYVDAFRVTTAASLPERQAKSATRLSQRMLFGEGQLLVNFRALYNDVWHNPDALTPQQVCDALGNRAGSLFVIAGTMANALYQIDPAGLGAMINTPAGYTAAIHDDGTVALTYTPPAPTPTPTPTP